MPQDDSLNSASRKSTSKALSHSRSLERGCGCFFGLFFGFFILVGTVVLFPLFLLPVLQYLETTSWVETPCEIVSSRVIRENEKNRIAVQYKYRIQGKEFRGHKYRNYEVVGASRSSLEHVVNKLQPGTKTVCYVNPENNSQAVLDRSFSPMLLVGLFPLVFVFIGLLGLIFSRSLVQRFITARLTGVKHQEWRTEAAIKEQRQSSTGDGHNGEWEMPSVSTGPIELKSSSSPITGAVFAAIFALFWNGIVSLFLYEVVDDWANGRHNWFLAFFLIPFVLIGIGAILAAIYTFLALFNPKPKVTVSDATTILGESFVLNWQFPGSTSSIRKMQVQLVGTEWVQYQQGTSTYTDTREFYCEDLFETDQPMEMTEGELEVVIPVNTMHSFNASHNKIKWSLRIKGDIPMWPDVNRSYEFTVLPLPVEQGAIPG